VIPKTREHGTLAGIRSLALTPEILARFDAAVIVTDHDAIDYEVLLDHARLVVDTRGRLRGRSERVVPA